MSINASNAHYNIKYIDANKVIRTHSFLGKVAEIMG